MIKSPSLDYYYGLQNKIINSMEKMRSMTPIKANKFTFENSVEKLKVLPLNADEYHQIKWLNITSINAQTKIFPKTFTQDTFNQGNTGLCFLFSCLSSIATIPSLIYSLFGNNDNWRQKKSFIVYFFYNNQRKQITISDNFPFETVDGNNYWIWSLPSEDNELFTKIIEKAYLKYQLIYGSYFNDGFDSKNILSNISKIIFKGGYEKDAMKILVNSQFKSIYNAYNNNYNRNIDHNKIFQEIIKAINEKALITLARIFKKNGWRGHSYSVLGAWNITRGNVTKQVLCIKNPWSSGNNERENFDLKSLFNSIKDFPTLIEFNKKYFCPSQKTPTHNYYDDIIGNKGFNTHNSIFIAPLDFLMEQGNGLASIEAHTPNYKNDFPEVEEQLKLYNKLDSLFKLVQNKNVKNVYDSNIDGEREITRVLSVGDKNTREIISKINNKENYLITKNGDFYCELTKGDYGDYKIKNMSEDFHYDYADNIALITNNITGEKKYISLNKILNCNQKHFRDKSITLFDYNIRPATGTKTNFYSITSEKKINDNKNIYNDYYNINQIEKPYNVNRNEIILIKDTKNSNDDDYNLNQRQDTNNHRYKLKLKKKTFQNFQIKPKKKYTYFTNMGDNTHYYENGDYYKGEFWSNYRHGKGEYYFKNGDYEKGTFSFNKFIEGKKKITYSDESYEGDWKYENKNGYGVQKVNGDIFKGYFFNGLKHGKFKVIYSNGKIDDNVEYVFDKQKSICLLF